jgi:hypothetical protein
VRTYPAGAPADIISGFDRSRLSQLDDAKWLEDLQKSPDFSV